MLREVVAAGELLSTLVTFERLVTGVEGSVMSLQVFLTSESAVADLTHEGLGGILSERLLASTAVDRWLLGCVAGLRSFSGVVGAIGLG